MGRRIRSAEQNHSFSTSVIASIHQRQASDQAYSRIFVFARIRFHENGSAVAARLFITVFSGSNLLKDFFLKIF
jgi:hypothetical protein